MNGFRTAWIFLTRVPIGNDPHPDPARSVPWFPVVGAVIGAIAAAVWALGHEFVGPLPAAAVAVTVGALVTGAFHHDGLADMADAFGGGWNRTQRLEILKDSRHGTYGVMALVCVIVVQVSALATHGPAQGAAALIAAHCLARAGAVAMILVVPPARDSGMGASFEAGVRASSGWIGVAAGVAIAVVALGPHAVAGAVAVSISVAAVAGLTIRKIGGFVGDVLGAAEQVGECAVLLTTAAMVHHQWAIPWWSA